MFRIDDPTNTPILPAILAAGTQGYFSRGNPAGGIRPTTMSVDWANTIQEELMAILAAAGVSPSKADMDQVLAALNILYNPGRLVAIQVPTSDGTVTLNARTTWCRCILIGGGGGGGYTDATGVAQSASAGGGASGSFLDLIVPAATIVGDAYVIGAGGAAGIGASATPATAGGNTSIGALVAHGGGAGTGSPANAGPATVGGGVPSALDPVTTGASLVLVSAAGNGGEAGAVFAAGTQQFSGKGGGGPYGGAGHNKTDGAGGDGRGPGSGGGGAASPQSTAARNGGAGRKGAIVIYEYT